MSVIKKAQSKYNYYLSKISLDRDFSSQNSVKIDWQISLAIQEDNLSLDLYFNIIYWGSPVVKRLPPDRKVSYVLKILNAANS